MRAVQCIDPCRAGSTVNPNLLLEPSPHDWEMLLNRPTQRPEWLEKASMLTRQGLELEPGVPVAATGHQAQLWHAGILAKDLALHALPATPLHLVADHDSNDAGIIPIPRDEEGRLSLDRWRALAVQPNAATGAQPAGTPFPPPPGSPSAAETIYAALASHATAPSLAMQVAQATASLGAKWSGVIPRRSVSSLLHSPIGEALLARMLENPHAAAETYNQAIHSAHRLARPLAIDGNRVELPLWHDTPSGRARVRSDNLPDQLTLRPNAMMAIALIQLGACDLYVSGTGGIAYGEAMARWIGAWLGDEIRAALAPTVVASATLTLEHTPRLPSERPEAFDRIRNDPLAQSSGGPSLAKQHLLDTINTAPPRSQERREAFDALRAWIAKEGINNAETLDALETLAANARTISHEQTLAESREWPFPFLASEDLNALAEATQASFSNGVPR